MQSRMVDLLEARIDESVRRILLAKEQFRVLDWQPLDPNTAVERINQAVHIRLVQELFHSGVTLVYDRNGTIPLSGDIALIYPATRPSIWSKCQMEHIRPVGVSESPTDEEISWAQGAASRADTVVVFTINAENNSQQKKLVNALPAEKVIVVAFVVTV